MPDMSNPEQSKQIEPLEPSCTGAPARYTAPYSFVTGVLMIAAPTTESVCVPSKAELAQKYR